MAYFDHHFETRIARHAVGTSHYTVVYLDTSLHDPLPFARHARLRIQADISGVPVKGAWQPARGTDQKLHVHEWLCVTAYLLATLVHRTAVRNADYASSVDTLFTELTQIRRATVARATTRGRARQTHHLEAPTPLQTRLIRRPRHSHDVVSIYRAATLSRDRTIA